MFPKIRVPPKSSNLIGFSTINHPFWGTPILGNTQMVVSNRKSPFPKTSKNPQLFWRLCQVQEGLQWRRKNKSQLRVWDSEMGFSEEKTHMPYAASAICFVWIEPGGVLYLGSTFFFFSSFFLKLNGPWKVKEWMEIFWDYSPFSSKLWEREDDLFRVYSIQKMNRTLPANPPSI